MATLAELGYLAGIIDGEGCISIRPPRGGIRYQIGVGINMTDLDILERCQRIAGAGTISGPQQRGTNKPIWVWHVRRQKEAAALLMTVYPLMSARRRERIEEALAIWRSQTVRKTPEPYGIPGENGCGTYAGYARHAREKTPTCQACRDAANDYRRPRRRKT